MTRNAVSLFPRKNGVIVVNGNPYFYDNRIDNEDPNYAKLTNIQSDTTKIPSAFPLNVTADSTYVILSPEIYVITSEGKSGNVTYTEEWHNQYGGSIYDREDALRLSPESRKPDIEFEQEDLLNNIVDGPTSLGLHHSQQLEQKRRHHRQFQFRFAVVPGYAADRRDQRLLPKRRLLFQTRFSGLLHYELLRR